MNFKEDLRQHFNILLTKKQEKMFEVYYNSLIDYNKHTNLTTITDLEDVYYKHFYDSLTIDGFIYNKDSILCDMGSGAGFPSIPLKIINPDLKVVILDSSNKRIKFLEQLTASLELENVELVHTRIEEYALDNLNKFDYVTARALGNLTLISEMAIPMLKTGGRFIAMKGSKGYEELEDAKNALNVLKGKVVIKEESELPYDYGSRSTIIIEKEKHVSDYPRRFAEMKKKPL